MAPINQHAVIPASYLLKVQPQGHTHTQEQKGEALKTILPKSNLYSNVTGSMHSCQGLNDVLSSIEIQY